VGKAPNPVGFMSEVLKNKTFNHSVVVTGIIASDSKNLDGRTLLEMQSIALMDTSALSSLSQMT
jgi:hypothetical protein